MQLPCMHICVHLCTAALHVLFLRHTNNTVTDTRGRHALRVVLDYGLVLLRDLGPGFLALQLSLDPQRK
jgi:hypothetical protein